MAQVRALGPQIYAWKDPKDQEGPPGGRGSQEFFLGWEGCAPRGCLGHGREETPHPRARVLQLLGWKLQERPMPACQAISSKSACRL